MLGKISLALILAFSFAAFSHAQNLVDNGKFEAGVEGWEILKTEGSIKAEKIEYSKDYAAYGLMDNYAGTYFVELDAASSLSQTIPTKSEEKYTIAFGYAARPGAGDEQLMVQIGGKTVYTKTIKNTEGTTGFRYKHIDFVAHSEATKIGFYTVPLSGAEDKGILITNIFCNNKESVKLELHYDY